jgi:hypothetical protein
MDYSILAAMVSSIVERLFTIRCHCFGSSSGPSLKVIGLSALLVRIARLLHDHCPAFGGLLDSAEGLKVIPNSILKTVINYLSANKSQVIAK